MLVLLAALGLLLLLGLTSETVRGRWDYRDIKSNPHSTDEEFRPAIQKVSPRPPKQLLAELEYNTMVYG